VIETTVEGQYAQLFTAASQVVQRKPDVLLAGNSPTTRALHQASHTIPIVFVAATDPVGNGFVTSLARPGGNVTGLASAYDDTTSKQLELLAMLVPGASRIGLLGNSENPATPAVLKVARDSAEKAGLAVVMKEVRDPAQIEPALKGLVAQHASAMLLIADPVFFGVRTEVARLAFDLRLPTMFPTSEYAEAGGLMSYGQSQRELWRQSATYVHKLMRGAKPTDLPVEQPTRYHLTLNLKTANTLGLTIPETLLATADEVIQ
jgi:putative tryptophan/tyrosine transport system substrate-binding protein